MKRFFVWLTALTVLFYAAGSAAAQCGNHFTAKYRAVNKLAFSGEYPRPYLLDDWTGDGRLDYWSFQVNSANSTNDIIIYPAKATGYWDWDNPIIYTTAITGRPHSGNTSENTFYVKDFNSDGRIDLRFNNLTYQNSGSGSLTTLAPFVITYSPGSSVTIVGYFDLNTDGLLDVMTRVYNNGVWSYEYYPANTDGSVDSAVSIFSSPEISSSGRQFIDDFNGDGRNDIVYASSNGYRVLLNAGNGSFTAGNLIQSVNGLFGFYGLKDFNSDGRLDILSIATGLKLFIWFGQANGTFTEGAPQQISDRSIFKLKIAELNGDSNPDLVAYNETQYVAYINNGSNVFTETVYQKHLPRASFLSDNLVFADFTGDGKADMVEAYYTNYNAFYEPVVTVYENVCQGSGGETKRLNFDGNGASDYVTWNPSTGEWSSRNNTQSGAYEQLRKFTWGTGSLGDVPAPGDFDGDGKSDYSVFRNSTGTWYVLLSSNSSWLVQQFGLPGDIAVPNDYDGGGKTDLAVFRPSDGNWYIWYSETQSFGALHFGATGDKPVPSDYDGDGKTDVAVYRASEGVWYYQKSSDGSFSVYQWGIATDKPLPADYDGDGKSDLAVFRDGVWYVWRSSDNTYGYLYFGTGGDVPLVSHTSSTNVLFANPSVFRASASAFYGRFSVLSSFWDSSSVAVQFGLPNN